MRTRATILGAFVNGIIVSSGVWSALYSSAPCFVKVAYILVFVTGGYLNLRLILR